MGRREGGGGGKGKGEVGGRGRRRSRIVGRVLPTACLNTPVVACCM